MAIVMAAVLVLVPILILPNFLFYFDITPKIAAFLLGTAIALPLGAKSLHVLWQTAISRWLVILLAAQAASLALSTLFSSNPWLSFTGTNWRRFGLMTQAALLIFTALLAAYAWGDDKRVRQLLWVITISGIPVAGYGILQYFGWDLWIPKQAYHIGEGVWGIVRPPGTLGYANYFAAYLTTVVFASAGLAMMEQDRRWKSIAMLGACLASAGIVLSGTRAAMLALITGGWLLLWWIRRGVKVTAAGVAIVAVVLFYFSPAGQNLRSRAKWSADDVRGGARPQLWRDSLRMSIQYWPAGAGVETFSASFPRFESRELARAFPDFYHESPHNILLDAFAAQGMFGLAALAGLTALGFYAGWKSRAENRILSGALTAALAAELVSGQFVSFTLPTALFFYVTVALLVAVRRAGGHSSPQTRLGILLGAAAVIVAIGIAGFATELLLYDRALAKTNGFIRSNNITQAALEYKLAEKWRPPGASADLWYSRAMAAHQAWSESLRAAMVAPVRAEDPQNAWYNLAGFYAAENDAARTEQSLRSAIACAPNWFKPHWTLARLLAATGRWREAGQEAALAADLDAGKDPEVASTLAEIHAAGK